MDDFEKIEGEKIFSLLEQLKHDHTILNIRIFGSDFDGLSIILSISRDEKSYFTIDYPGGSNDVDSIAEGERCLIEFNGEGKINFRFRTTINKISETNIRLNFPEFIERIQRRKFFRVPVFSGTKLIYQGNNKNIEFDIINISEGGVSIGIKAEYHNKKILFKGNKLKNLSVSSTNEYLLANLKINSGEIIRVENLKETKRFNYSLKFVDIDKKEQGELKSFIYNCQRIILKKRGGMDG